MKIPRPKAWGFFRCIISGDSPAAARINPRIATTATVIAYGICVFTSYGTSGIMIPIAFPIAVGMSGGEVGSLAIVTIAAVTCGAVFGDHCSPISDTTISQTSMASLKVMIFCATAIIMHKMDVKITEYRILMQRDYGPMYKAEKRARLTGKLYADNAKPMMSKELDAMNVAEGAPLRIYNRTYNQGVCNVFKENNQSQNPSHDQHIFGTLCFFRHGNRERKRSILARFLLLRRLLQLFYRLSPNRLCCRWQQQYLQVQLSSMVSHR